MNSLINGLDSKCTRTDRGLLHREQEEVGVSDLNVRECFMGLFCPEISSGLRIACGSRSDLFRQREKLSPMVERGKEERD